MRKKKRGKREENDVYATLCPVFIVRCLSLTFAVAPGRSCHFLYKDSTFFLLYCKLFRKVVSFKFILSTQCL